MAPILSAKPSIAADTPLSESRVGLSYRLRACPRLCSLVNFRVRTVSTIAVLEAPNAVVTLTVARLSIIL